MWWCNRLPLEYVQIRVYYKIHVQTNTESVQCLPNQTRSQSDDVLLSYGQGVFYTLAGERRPDIVCDFNIFRPMLLCSALDRRIPVTGRQGRFWKKNSGGLAPHHLGGNNEQHYCAQLSSIKQLMYRNYPENGGGKIWGWGGAVPPGPNLEPPLATTSLAEVIVSKHWTFLKCVYRANNAGVYWAVDQRGCRSAYRLSLRQKATSVHHHGRKHYR